MLKELGWVDDRTEREFSSARDLRDNQTRDDNQNKERIRPSYIDYDNKSTVGEMINARSLMALIVWSSIVLPIHVSTTLKLLCRR